MSSPVLTHWWVEPVGDNGQWTATVEFSNGWWTTLTLPTRAEALEWIRRANA